MAAGRPRRLACLPCRGASGRARGRPRDSSSADGAASASAWSPRRRRSRAHAQQRLEARLQRGAPTATCPTRSAPALVRGRRCCARSSASVRAARRCADCTPTTGSTGGTSATRPTCSSEGTSRTTSPGGGDLGDRARRAGYAKRTARGGSARCWRGAWRRRSTAAATVAAWLDSPDASAHPDLARYSDIGVGTVAGTPVERIPSGVTVAAMFGRAALLINVGRTTSSARRCGRRARSDHVRAYSSSSSSCSAIDSQRSSCASCARPGQPRPHRRRRRSRARAGAGR